VTGLITERGVLQPDREALARAFPVRVRGAGVSDIARERINFR